jgi:hypothetical protein
MPQLPEGKYKVSLFKAFGFNASPVLLQIRGPGVTRCLSTSQVSAVPASFASDAWASFGLTTGTWAEGIFYCDCAPTTFDVRYRYASNNTAYTPVEHQIDLLFEAI